MLKDSRIETYFSAIKSRNADAVSNCFIEDGILIVPTGQIIQGRAAIAGFYRQLFASTPPSPEVLNELTSQRYATVELGGAIDGQRIAALDHFTFSENDLIERLAIYALPTAPA